MLYPTSMGTHKQIRVHFRPSLSKRKKAIGPAMTPPSGNRDAIHDRACSGTSVRSQVQFVIWWGWGQQRAGSTLGRTIDDHPIEHPHENDPKVAWKKIRMYKISSFFFSFLFLFSFLFFLSLFFFVILGKNKVNGKFLFAVLQNLIGTKCARVVFYFSPLFYASHVILEWFKWSPKAQRDINLSKKYIKTKYFACLCGAYKWYVMGTYLSVRQLFEAIFEWMIANHGFFPLWLSFSMFSLRG